MGGRALREAAGRGDLVRVRALLAEGSCTTADASDALVFATIHAAVDVMDALMDFGADPNFPSEGGSSPLSYAVSRGLAVMDRLLRRGADAKARNSYGYDALHKYLQDVGPGSRLGTGDVAIVRKLLNAGLDVKASNAEHSHLPLACVADRVDIVELLLREGADPNATTKESIFWSALSSRQRAGMLRLLVQYGLAPNARCTNAAEDATILMAVCREGDIESARRLLDAGAEVNVRGRGTPLSCAEESGNQALVDLLLERGAQSSRPSLDSGLAAQLDTAEASARAKPSDAGARVAWAEALLHGGFRAAAAREVDALRGLGASPPSSLERALEFERPSGVTWRFVRAAEAALPTDVTPRVTDARMPLAHVSDGVRTVPYVLTLGTPCTRCDDQGEQECTSCNGTGSYSSFLDPDHDVQCNPRQQCSTCRGLKFAVTGRRFGKGACKHPKTADELTLGSFTFRRCVSCGLPALWGHVFNRYDVAADFACAVCERFECTCASAG